MTKVEHARVRSNRVTLRAYARMTFGLYGTTLTTRIRDVGTIFGTTRPENEVSAGLVGTGTSADLHVRWWRGQDLNLRPSGYEPTRTVQRVLTGRIDSSETSA